MYGIAPKMPLTTDADGGPYAQVTLFANLVKQNFKNLILTSPGERVMIPDFGVGIYSYLFEQKTAGLYNKIERRVREQVRKFMPFIKIDDIIFYKGEEEGPYDTLENSLRIRIDYTIVPLDKKDIIDIDRSVAFKADFI